MPREQGYVHGECPEVPLAAILVIGSSTSCQPTLAQALRMDEFVAYLRAAQHRSEENWTEASEPFIFVDGCASSLPSRDYAQVYGYQLCLCLLTSAATTADSCCSAT